MVERHYEIASGSMDLIALQMRARHHGEDCARADYADARRFLEIANVDFEAWLERSAPSETDQALCGMTANDQAVMRAQYQRAFEEGYRAALHELLTQRA